MPLIILLENGENGETMRILTSIKKYMEEDASNKEILHDVLSLLQDAFWMSAQDKEVSFAIDLVEESDVIFGKDHPEQLTAAVEKWNENIVATLVNELKSFIQANPEWDKGHIKLESRATYGLKKAAIAADDGWYDFADQAVFLENMFGFPYFRQILDDKQIQHIVRNPGDYIIVDVPVK
jgi:hypothetical protein